AGLVASNTLGSQISAINQSLTNSNRANDVLSTADAGLQQISGLLDQIRSLVQAGLSTGGLTPDEQQANQQQIDQALSAVNTVSANTTFAGEGLIDGSKSYTTQVSSADSAKVNSFQLNSVAFSGTPTVTLNAKVKTAATQGQLFYGFVNGGLASNTTLELSGAQGTNVVSLGQGSSLSDIKSAINSVTTATGVTATATAAVYGSASFGSAGSNNGLTFTDIQSKANNPNQGVNTQPVTIKFATAAANQNLSVSSTSTSNSITLTITLGTDGAAAVTSTASDVKALINASATSSGYVSVSLEGSGAGTVVGAGTSKTESGGTNGSLTLQSQDFGSSQFVGVSVLQGTFATNAGSVGGTASSRSTGTDIVATINGQQAVGNGLSAAVTSETLDGSITFNTADNVANTTAAITVTGGGSVFQIGQQANLSGQVNLGLPAVNTAVLGGTSGKLFQLGSGGSLSLANVGPSVQGSTLVSVIDDAINQVSSLSGRIGALQSNVINTNIATLNSALENVSQAQSDILDTNFAQETANMTRAQILEQSGISVLSIANQTPSQVLKLLQ
ncbi:MAG TPA: flagellin, partial [Planctomycetaceae bacterium]|nr:flagellin [Planctomycetaceae bacterium]